VLEAKRQRRLQEAEEEAEEDAGIVEAQTKCNLVGGGEEEAEGMLEAPTGAPSAESLMGECDNDSDSDSRSSSNSAERQRREARMERKKVEKQENETRRGREKRNKRGVDKERKAERETEKKEKKTRKKKKRSKKEKRSRDSEEGGQRSVITGKRIKKSAGSVADKDGEARRERMRELINGGESEDAWAKRAEPKSEMEDLAHRARFDPALMKELMEKGHQAQREREGRRGKRPTTAARQKYLADVLAAQREQGLR